MKIKVTPEGRKDVYIPEKESLKAWIESKNFEYIHNFVNAVGGMFVGADHEVKSVLEDIDRAERLGILANDTRKENLGHALSLIENNKLEVYDIGEVTDNDLDIEKTKERG